MFAPMKKSRLKPSSIYTADLNADKFFRRKRTGAFLGHFTEYALLRGSRCTPPLYGARGEAL